MTSDSAGSVASSPLGRVFHRALDKVPSDARPTAKIVAESKDPPSFLHFFLDFFQFFLFYFFILSVKRVRIYCPQFRLPICNFSFAPLFDPLKRIISDTFTVYTGGERETATPWAAECVNEKPPDAARVRRRRGVTKAIRLLSGVQFVVRVPPRGRGTVSFAAYSPNILISLVLSRLPGTRTRTEHEADQKRTRWESARHEKSTEQR